jgi:hypothetical protein
VAALRKKRRKKKKTEREELSPGLGSFAHDTEGHQKKKGTGSGGKGINSEG